jgi:hypothetical protein
MEQEKAIGAGESVPPRDTRTKRTVTTQEPVTLDPEPESFTPKPKPKKSKPEAVVPDDHGAIKARYDRLLAAWEDEHGPAPAGQAWSLYLDEAGGVVDGMLHNLPGFPVVPDAILGVPDQAKYPSAVPLTNLAHLLEPYDETPLSRQELHGEILTENPNWSDREVLDHLLSVIRLNEAPDLVAVAKPSEAAEILAWAKHFRPISAVGKPAEAPQPVEEASVDPEACDHPVTRRLGRNCMACGSRVK